MNLTPEQVAAFTDDELRLAVARRIYPDNNCTLDPDDLGVVVDTDGSEFIFDPLSPASAFKLMVEYKIYPREIGRNKIYAYGNITQDGGRSSATHPATEHGTARAICEAFLLMGE